MTAITLNTRYELEEARSLLTEALQEQGFSVEFSQNTHRFTILNSSNVSENQPENPLNQ